VDWGSSQIPHLNYFQFSQFPWINLFRNFGEFPLTFFAVLSFTISVKLSQILRYYLLVHHALCPEQGITYQPGAWPRERIPPIPSACQAGSYLYLSFIRNETGGGFGGVLPVLLFYHINVLIL